MQQLEAEPPKKSFASFHSNSSFNFFCSGLRPTDGNEIDQFLKFWPQLGPGPGLTDTMTSQGHLKEMKDCGRKAEKGQKRTFESKVETRIGFFIGKTVTVLAASNSKLTSP